MPGNEEPPKSYSCLQFGGCVMSSELRLPFCAGVSVCALFYSSLAFAATMGSLAPHDPPANGQATEQWISDPRTQCVAADPSYTQGDSISWQGQCRKDAVIYGKGTLTFLNGGRVVETITGTFNDGLPQAGPVTAIWADGTKYQGSQLGGLFNGPGKFVSVKGETHDGVWKMGVFQSGNASVTWPNGDRYDGEWKNGKPDGQGVEVWADGRRYEGQWRDGAPLGDVPLNGNDTSVAPGSAMAASAAVGAAAPTAMQAASAGPPSAVASSTPPHVASAPHLAAMVKSGNAAPNPALPLRAELGTQFAAVDGATLELGLTDDGFERTLVLPNGNSQEIAFAFANGPVGTVSDGAKDVGVFRARPDELDIDYADGTSETIGEAAGGGLVERAHSLDGHAMCTAWYPQGHVFSETEKEAAVQEYATRLGLPVSAPAKKTHAHDSSQACGGAFIASGSAQKTADAGTPANEIAKSAPAPQPRTAGLDNAVVTVPAAMVHRPDQRSAQFEKASFAPDQPAQPTNDLAAPASALPPPQPGASNCLSVTSNGDYWGFQNRCARTVQFAYCEMSDANPLTSCNHASVVGSVAANGFSALVSDRGLAEKNAEHEFRWMACDGGAGEVIPHLDRIDPPSGRCERAVVAAQ